MGKTKRSAVQPSVENTVEIETTTTNSEANVVHTPRILEDLSDLNDSLAALDEQMKADLEQEALDDAEIEHQISLGNSVVNRKYKIKYKLLAKERGDRSKAAKRSNWDWLAQQMAELTLTSKAKLRVDEFVALMAANGIDCDRWPNRAPGWEGRLRMTACLVLRKQMAEEGSGILHLADGSTRQMPEHDLAVLKGKFPI